MIDGRAGRSATNDKVRRIEPRASAANRAVAPPYRTMLDNAPINVVFADPDLVIRYVNPASLATLRTIAHLLPVPVEEVVGSSLDIFHQQPGYEREILADPSRLPHHALITVGAEKVDVLVSAVHDDDEYLGPMVTWSVATERYALETALEQSAELLAIAADALGTIDEEHGAQAEAVASRASESCADIGNAIGRITDVARRTERLALQTTLEAARAGEAGKGLVVVADAMKRLAQESVQATDDVRRNIETVGPDDEGVVAAIRLVAVVLGQMNRIQSTIATAVERQTATANEIARNVGEAANGSDRIAQNVVRVLEAARGTGSGPGEPAPARDELARTMSELQSLVTRLRH